MVLCFVGKELGAQIGGHEFDLPRPHKEKQGSWLSHWNAGAGEMAKEGFLGLDRQPTLPTSKLLIQ